MLLVAEIFGDRQRGQRHAPARTGRLVHLTIYEHGALEHARVLHVGEQLMPLARSLADTCKHRDALVFLDHRMDQLHHEHGLTDASAAEHRPLAALCERGKQIDHLYAGLEDHRRCSLVAERRRSVVDAAPRRVGREFGAVVAQCAHHVDQPSEERVADRHLHWLGRCTHRGVARQSHCRLQRNAADRYRIDMAVDFQHQQLWPIQIDDQRRVNRGQLGSLEADIDHGTTHRNHGAFCEMIGFKHAEPTAYDARS
jgi:hypothetical protein